MGAGKTMREARAPKRRIRLAGPGPLARVGAAALEWVYRYNHRRLFEPLGHVPPAAFEAHYYHQLQEPAMAA